MGTKFIKSESAGLEQKIRQTKALVELSWLVGWLKVEHWPPKKNQNATPQKIL